MKYIPSIMLALAIIIFLLIAIVIWEENMNIIIKIIVSLLLLFGTISIIAIIKNHNE